MKSQYILIATLIIISLIFSIFYNISYPTTKVDLSYYGRNLESEVYYISSNFSKKYIGDFLEKFLTYMKKLGYNFSYICISPIDLGIQQCGDISINCCYYFTSNISVNKSILRFCDKSFVLYNEGIICICYNISSESSYYVNFICT